MTTSKPAEAGESVTPFPFHESSDTFDIAAQTIRGWYLVIAQGDLTSDGASTLIACVDTGIESGRDRIVVDLARITEVSPSCMAALARVDSAVRATGGDLRLVVDGVVALQAIREAGLSGRFHINRYVGDIVGAVAGLDEGGRGARRRGLKLR